MSTKLERAAREILRTSRPVVAAIRLWLSEDECECEMFHHCGKAQREREASEAESAIAALESALKELEAPAVPTDVDLTSKMRTQFKRLRRMWSDIRRENGPPPSRKPQ